MKIYVVTDLGHRFARSTNNPNTAGWQVLHYLDSVGHSTPDQIASYTGVSGSELSVALGRLRRGGLIREVTGGESYV